MQDAQDPSAAVPVDLPFFQPKCFSHYDPSTIFFYYIFRRATTVVGVSRDTPGMYGQTLKKKW